VACSKGHAIELKYLLCALKRNKRKKTVIGNLVTSHLIDYMIKGNIPLVSSFMVKNYKFYYFLIYFTTLFLRSIYFDKIGNKRRVGNNVTSAIVEYSPGLSWETLEKIHIRLLRLVEIQTTSHRN
jgi:hypothetical protein